MATPLGAMRIDLELDSSKFSSSLTASKKAVTYFKAEARALDAALKNNGNNMTLLSTKQKTLTQAMTKQGEVLEKLKANFDKMDVGSKKWESAAIEIERENAKLEQLRGELGRVETALSRVHAENSRWGKVGNALTNWGEGMKQAGAKLRTMGDAMKPVSTILSAGFTLATKKALDFGGQMQTTKALLSDTIGSASELNKTTEKLGDASKGWSRQFGISTTEINTGMQEIIKAGLDANQTMGAMPAILTASKATGEDFNTVMNASTSIMSQFGLITSDTTQMLKNTNRVTDSLSFVANKTKAGFSDMGLAMEYVGPVANSVGMDIEETAAAIGILSNAGIGGQKAGTALRGALSKLLDPSKENAAAFEKLGFSAEEFRSGAIKLPDVIERIKKNTEGMTDAQKAAIIAQAFGVEAQSGINALVNEGADSLRNLTTETKNAEGYTDSLYKKMSGSGKSAVDRFKSSIEVLQITIGEKLLPILTPIVEKLTEGIEKFSEADEGTQRFWTTIAGGVALAYPALNFLGNLSSITGTLVKGLGGLASKKAAASALASLGTSATATGTALAGTAGNTSLLSSAMGLVTNPIGATVAAVGLLTGGLLYLNHQKDESRRKVAEWGTALDSATKKDLQSFKDKVDEARLSLETFSSNGSDNINKVKESFGSLVEEIANNSEKAKQRLEELGDKLGLSDEQVARGKARLDRIVENSKTMTDEIAAIYEKHNGDIASLTDEEKAIVESNTRELIDAKLAMLDLSNKEERAIRQAFSDDMNMLNETQLEKTIASLEKSITKEKELYKSKRADLKEALNSGMMDREEYNKRLESLETEHQATMDALGQKFIEAQRALGKQQGENAEDIARTAKTALEKMGLDYAELAKKVDNAAKKGSADMSLLAQSTKDMSVEAQQANTLWNSLTFDDKEGKVKSNAIEEVMKASQSAEGWNNLMFMLKEANLTTNARTEVATALMESGRWSSMTLDEKKLVVDNQAGLLSIVTSEEKLNAWNAMPARVKELLGNNEDFLNKTEIADRVMANWNALTPKTQELLARDMASENTVVAQSAINSLVGKSVDLFANNLTAPGASAARAEIAMFNGKDVPLGALNLTGPAVAEAQASVNSPRQIESIKMAAQNNTAPAVAETHASVNSPIQLAPIPMFGINMTAPEVGSTQASVNSPRQMSAIPMFARNNTAGPVLSAMQAVNSPRQHSPATINAINNASGPARQAKWDLDIIPRNITSTITTVYQSIKKAIGFEKGTNFHRGGPAVVNDQKGPLYKELVTLPSGQSFIPEGRDVLLDLPRGSKVLPAAKTKKLMTLRGIPKYAEGVGYPVDAPLFREIEQAEKQLNQNIQVTSDNKETVALLKAILSAINDKDFSNNHIEINAGSEEREPDYYRLADKIGQILASQIQRKAQMKGVST